MRSAPHPAFTPFAALFLLALSAAARTCGIDLAAVEARIKDLEPAYGRLLSDIAFDAPWRAAHGLLCDAAEAADATPWRMARLDDLGWIYAVENAIGRSVDLAAPPRDGAFQAARNVCTDEACLCGEFIRHTNAGLGGTSPYP